MATKLNGEYISTTAAAAIIRKTLKFLGWNSRAVSVRTAYFAGGSSLRIRIKTATVPSTVVYAVAQLFESVARCSYTGDILSGGNTYLSVDYDSNARFTLGRPWVDKLRAIPVDTDQSNRLYPVDTESIPIHIKRSKFCDDSKFDLWIDSGFAKSVYGTDSAAFEVGRMVLESRYTNIRAEINSAGSVDCSFDSID